MYMYIACPVVQVDGPGSKAHEAFMYNAALGRLDVYAFDLWNMHQCQCPQPQEDMGICLFGFYRWSINAFTYLRNVTSSYKARVPKFDEPTVRGGGGLGVRCKACPDACALR
jgi:hypothetical protein